MLILSFLIQISFSLSITEDPFYSHEVLFTNPECQTYAYNREVYSNRGDLLLQKPQNVYCGKRDEKVSGSRKNSPQQRLVDWISDPNTKQIFLAFLSFSDKRVMQALCDGIETRNLKVKMILDVKTSSHTANMLSSCKPENGLKDYEPQIHYRGRVSGIALAHMKLVLINPKDYKSLLAFSSANLTAGTVLHHENWHFMSLSKNSYFLQSHICAMQGMLYYAVNSGRDFREFLQLCRESIDSPKEEDAIVYFAPAEGRIALRHLTELIEESEKIDIAAHRFSNRSIIGALKKKLLDDENSVRLIMDDDLYWTYKGIKVGPNTQHEVDHIWNLKGLGLDLRYFETNHYERLLHHNKFVILESNKKDWVFTGAGNLTGAAFTSNLENFYLFSNPNVIRSFKEQYDLMWHNMATRYENMPQIILKPEVLGN